MSLSPRDSHVSSPLPSLLVACRQFYPFEMVPVHTNTDSFELPIFGFLFTLPPCA